MRRKFPDSFMTIPELVSAFRQIALGMLDDLQRGVFIPDVGRVDV